MTIDGDNTTTAVVYNIQRINVIGSQPPTINGQLQKTVPQQLWYLSANGQMLPVTNDQR